MDRHLFDSFHIPAATLNIFSVLPMLLTIVIYDRVLVPLARSLTGLDSGITYIQRMCLGFAISLFSNISASIVEYRRRRAASMITGRLGATVPMSVFWLVPQYAVHGIADAFYSVGHMEFIYDQSPESMRSTAAALFWLSVALGNYGGMLLVTLVSNFTKKSKHGNWLQNDINKGRLDYYYWLVASMQVLNFAFYLVCVRFYRFKRLEITGDEIPHNVVDEEARKSEVELLGIN
ncbi:hypothetical protein HPP92_027801 [Vanilla planifolia]|uniref:Uncharacterized protein n=1 Tax=Vanilla planifolia TaxID=51239 RepID=A0A835P7M0_VANPL|nr:hypothetical protein HPP92_027801 [Vanilla planifolia]